MTFTSASEPTAPSAPPASTRDSAPGSVSGPVSEKVAGAGPGMLDVFHPAHRPDPYPVFRALRESGRFHPLPVGEGSLTLISHYSDCVAALHSGAWGHHSLPSTVNPFRPGSDSGEGLRSMLRTNPPAHTRLRALVSKAFTPRTVAHLRPLVTSQADALLDAALEKGEVDLIEAFARPLPLRVICTLLGVPPEDEETFGAWGMALSRGLDPDYLLTAAELAQRAEATRGFAAYFTELIAQRRAAPSDDLLSRLVTVQEQGDSLTESEMLETCVLLLVAGYETTINLVANGVLALLRNPGQLSLLRADPALTVSAVDEMLRYDPPVHWAGRVALEDTTLAGHRFAAGDGIVIVIGSAHRDPEAYPDPDRFDVTRFTGSAPATRHIAFGFGIHYCLGAALAKMEAEIMLTALLRRVRNLALTTDRLTYRPHLLARGLETLPVRLSA